MGYRSTVLIFIVVFGILFSLLYASQAVSSVNGNNCGESIKVVRAKAPFPILLPAALPMGYSLQSVDYVPNVFVSLQYLTRSLCDPNSPYSVEEGVIEIVEGPLSQNSDAKSGGEYVQRELKKYEFSNINATSFVFQNGRMHAVGYDVGPNYKAHLFVVDDKTGTLIKIEARSANIQLKDLSKIGESLEE